jgi:hypothetical protein
LTSGRFQQHHESLFYSAIPQFESNLGVLGSIFCLY